MDRRKKTFSKYRPPPRGQRMWLRHGRHGEIFWDGHYWHKGDEGPYEWPPNIGDYVGIWGETGRKGIEMNFNKATLARTLAVRYRDVTQKEIDPYVVENILTLMENLRTVVYRPGTDNGPMVLRADEMRSITSQLDYYREIGAAGGFISIGALLSVDGRNVGMIQNFHGELVLEIPGGDKDIQYKPTWPDLADDEDPDKDF